MYAGIAHPDAAARFTAPDSRTVTFGQNRVKAFPGCSGGEDFTRCNNSVTARSDYTYGDLVCSPYLPGFVGFGFWHRYGFHFMVLS